MPKARITTSIIIAYWIPSMIFTCVCTVRGGFRLAVVPDFNPADTLPANGISEVSTISSRKIRLTVRDSPVEISSVKYPSETIVPLSRNPSDSDNTPRMSPKTASSRKIWRGEAPLRQSR